MIPVCSAVGRPTNSSEGGRQCRIVKLLVRKDLPVTKLPDEDPSCAGRFAGGAYPASKLSQRHNDITICNPLIGLECVYLLFSRTGWLIVPALRGLPLRPGTFQSR